MNRRIFMTGVSALALAACAEPTFVPMGPNGGGAGEPVFVATTRAQGEDGWFTSARGRGVSFLKVPVHFPTNYVAGDLATIRASPDPDRDLSFGGPTRYRDGAAFEAALRAEMAGKPIGQKDITIYVHGFYNSFVSGVFRSAQMRRDFDLPGTMVHFAWPSRGNNTGYTYDRESVLFSRDALEDVVRRATQVGAERVTIIGHSLGAMLIMETLRQIEISDPGWVHENIRGLAFVAPDIDVQVFKSQAARFQRLPEDFVLFVSNRDRVLMLASSVSGVKRRLGNTRNVQITTEGELTIVDVSALTDDARSGHFVPATSPAAIKLMRNSDAFVDFFPREGVGQRIASNVRLFQVGEE